VIPDQGLWLGFYLDHTYDFQAGRMVGALDCSLDGLGADITSGAAYAHLDNREQAIVGILSAMLAYEFTNADLSQVPITATAIAQLMGHRFFWVEGRVLSDGNHHATLGVLKARTVMDAQLEIVAIPAFSALIHGR
jgi:hypothetical protein